MQRLIYTVDIDEEVYELDGLLEVLDETVKLSTDCGVVKSRIESSAEVCENGEWEEEDKMCPYMRVEENELPRCKPKDTLCTMCVAGNAKTYYEIERAEKQKGESHHE